MSLPKGVTTSEAAIVSILVTCHKESEWGDRSHTSSVSNVFSIAIFIPELYCRGNVLWLIR